MGKQKLENTSGLVDEARLIERRSKLNQIHLMCQKVLNGHISPNTFVIGRKWISLYKCNDGISEVAPYLELNIYQGFLMGAKATWQSYSDGRMTLEIGHWLFIPTIEGIIQHKGQIVDDLIQLTSEILRKICERLDISLEIKN